nr:unnamed protein product [Callosobruchus chinensis]
MRFRFCGEGDCPDWVLMEMNSLSKLQAAQLKSLCEIVVAGLISPPINMKKAEQLLSGATLDDDIDLKACIACLNFIISSTSRFNCDGNALQSELQQLGLPREHSTVIKRIVESQLKTLISTFKTQTLRFNNLTDCSGKVEDQYAVLDLTIADSKSCVKMSEHTLDVLLKNLQEIRGTMAELQKVSL